MNTALRVAFDISELGLGFCNPSQRRGINRVVEQVWGALGQLARDHPDTLDFTTSAVENSLRAKSFLNSQDKAALSALLPDGTAHRYWAKLERFSLDLITATTDRRFLKRALRYAVARTFFLQQKMTHLLPAFDAESVDVFHSPAQVPIPGYASRAKRPACFLTLFDFIPFRYPHLVHQKSVSDLRRAIANFGPGHFAICISQHVKDDACEYLKLDPQHFFVAPLAADPAIFYPCQDVARIRAVQARYRLPVQDRPYFLSLCTLEPRKNLLRLVQSFARLRREVPATQDALLVLVGQISGENRRQVESAVAAADLSQHVALTGYVADQDLAPIYSGALAFVFPSLAEGFGLPPLEAMQCGTPVVCSNRTSLPEVVGEAGMLVDPEDTDALGDAMDQVFSRSTFRENLARRSLERAALFSWKRCAADHLAAYQQGVQLHRA